MLEKIWSKKNTSIHEEEKSKHHTKIGGNVKTASKERLISQIHKELQKVTKKQKSEHLHIHLQNQL